MSKKMGTVATAAIALAVLSFMPPAQAGHGSAVGAGIVGFGVGAERGLCRVAATATSCLLWTGRLWATGLDTELV
jgi:hypothetical protein